MPQRKAAPQAAQTELEAGEFGDRPEGWPPTNFAMGAESPVGGQPSGRSPFDGRSLEGEVNFGARSAFQKQLVNRIFGFFYARITQRGQEGFERCVVGFGHLQADQNAAVVCTLVAVMKQADVPARPHG